MNIKLVCIAILFIITQIGNAQDINDLKASILKHIPGATITDLDPVEPFNGVLEVYIPQLLNHKKKKLGTFPQKVIIHHVNTDKPVVYITEGYSAFPRVYELTKMVEGNQIALEYRFNGKSKPEVIDWKLMTQEQGLEDLHRVRQLFGKIYKEAWLCTGISKGGTTTALYRFTYPKDTKAGIAYVGPFPNAQHDKRLWQYIWATGNRDCKNKIKAFRTAVLSRETELLPLIDSIDQADEAKYTLVNTKAALEYSALEYPFSFWQMTAGNCAEIPAPDAPAHDIVKHINDIVGLETYSDKNYDGLQAAFYQFLTQYGYYDFDTTGVSKYLDAIPAPNNLIFGPKDVDLSYEGKYMMQITDKIATKGKHIIFLYGSVDPWTACGIKPKNANMVRLEKRGGNHRIRIKDFDDVDRKKIYRSLEQWTKLKITPLPVTQKK